DVFGNHGLCGLPEEGAHEKSPKCLGGNLGDFWGDFAKVSNYGIPRRGRQSKARPSAVGRMQGGQAFRAKVWIEKRQIKCACSGC
ncbi:hypothetical protein, partial [Neisseria elongata]|uniref:hypothetical protein n=1 Tax=Neisseria elongata TaxID=495 RepID=UPI0024B26529